jgi:hypothetical protein
MWPKNAWEATREVMNTLAKGIHHCGKGIHHLSYSHVGKSNNFNLHQIGPAIPLHVDPLGDTLKSHRKR